MEFNTLETENIGGSGGGTGVGGDRDNDIRVFWSSMPPPIRQTSPLEYPVRGRGRGRLLPTPFLSKMYQIVDDPNTNAIISWGSSFIILDQMKFATEILPKYFKHGSFASFVYQLNNYGFRKTSWDKLEYETPWFQAGKEHWLPNITRRNQQSEPKSALRLASLAPSDDFANAGMEMMLEKLRTEQNSMKVEIQKLRQLQKEMENRFKSFGESTKFADSEHEETVDMLLAQQFIQHLKEKKEMAGKETSKRQKLIPSGSILNSEDRTDKEEILRQNSDGKDQVQEELNEMQPDGQIISSPDDSGSSNNIVQQA